MTGVRAIQLGQRYYVVTFMNEQTAHQYPEMFFKLVSGKIAYVYAATVCFMFRFTGMFCRWFKAL